jgi:hypothetical protein
MACSKLHEAVAIMFSSMWLLDTPWGCQLGGGGAAVLRTYICHGSAAAEMAIGPTFATAFISAV